MELRVDLNKQSGFTLIEFCVATLIMMVGILGLLQAVNMATSQNLSTVVRKEATMIADEQMVATKYGNYTSVKSGSLSVAPRKIRGGYSNYSVFRTVTAAGPSSKEVTISVRYRLKNKIQSHAISTLVVQP